MDEQRMKNDSVLKLLVEFSIPAMIGMLVNAIYNIVDRMFIGNAPQLGAIGLAGITITFPVTLVLMALSLMVGNGGATRFSIALGQQKHEEARKYMGNALILAIFFGAVFMIAGNLLMNPMLKVLGASDSTAPHAKAYLSIILYGAIFQAVSMCGNNFSRAQGNPKNAMISQLIGAGFNILFDYILIIQCKMGMEGAALATIGGQLLSAIWQLAFLFSKRCILPINKESLMPDFKMLGSIIVTGIPMFLLQMANSVLNIVLNSTVGKYGGDIALSTVGIITSFQTLLLMPITGLSQGQQPLISFNFGARCMDRVKETLRYAIMGGLIISMIGFIAVMFFPKLIISMFNSEPEIIKLGTFALRTWFMALPLSGPSIIMANYFQAIGKVKIASLLNLTRQVIILIPLIVILGAVFGLNGIFFAVPVAEASSFALAALMVHREMKKINQNKNLVA